MLKVFSDHMCPNIFSLSQHIVPVLWLPWSKFLTPLCHRILLLTLLFKSFHALLLFQCNCLKSEISTHLIKFPWQYEFDALQIVTLAPLTPFATHRLATPLFPVSHDLLPNNDIGFHTIRLLLTFDS